MDEVTPTSSRKSDHIRINLEEDVRSGLSNGLERYRFVHQALPELDLGSIDLSQLLFNKEVKAPILISSMTGGTAQAGVINRTLAQVAQECGLAMGLGSMRAALERNDSQASFMVRDVAPDILLFANLGAVQLNYGYSVDDCLRAVEIAQADALILHLNPLQEALQPEGQANFKGLLSRIHTVCKALPIPVIAKEVGWGISSKIAFQLAEAGISAIDVAGAGGTSWSQVEMYRNSDPHLKNVAAAFRNWGIPTAESIRQVRKTVPNMPIFASGGLTNGIEIAKCIALGARLGGMAGPFLKAASKGMDELIATVNEIILQIRVTMFAAGAGNLDELQKVKFIEQNPEE